MSDNRRPSTKKGRDDARAARVGVFIVKWEEGEAKRGHPIQKPHGGKQLDE
jgi:hypothetical protein